MGVNLSRLFLAQSSNYELATTVRDVYIAQGLLTFLVAGNVSP